MDTFTYRPVDLKDRREWIHMAHELWPDEDVAELEEVFDNFIDPKLADTSFVCCNNSEELIGFIFLALRHDYVEGSDSSPVGYVEGIYVQSHFRRQGIAAAFIQLAETWTREQGCTELGSDVELHNILSQHFHKAVGFEEANRVVCFIKKV